MSKIDQCAGATTVNKHIELVEKWLADNDSVSSSELEANAHAAYAAYVAAKAAAANANAAYAAYAANAADSAAEWVAKYHKSVKEQGL